MECGLRLEFKEVQLLKYFEQIRYLDSIYF
jgi:hypothetical protein